MFSQLSWEFSFLMFSSLPLERSIVGLLPASLLLNYVLRFGKNNIYANIT